MKITQGRTNEELLLEMQLRADSPSILTVLALDFDHYMGMVDYIATGIHTPQQLSTKFN